MIQIKPKKILNKIATQLDIRVDLNLNSETSTSFFNLRDDEGGLIYDDIIPIPSEIHSQWGTDDSVIEDYILSELNLTRL